MIIHVVQPEETIDSIADYYQIPVARLVLDNGLNDSDSLVIGQSIVIAYPEVIYTVKEGDTLTGIAQNYHVDIMQLLRNNPHLLEREYLYIGETIVISYPTEGEITIHGNTNPTIDKTILRRTLPYLTYLSVLNYTATTEGEIITYFDDTEIIKIAKQYSVVPLMLLTTLTIKGEANIGIEYDILLNTQFQNNYIQNILNILRTKGYLGVNISFQYLNISNLYLYNEFFTHIFNALNNEGFLVFVTINPNITNVNNEVRFEKIDYSILNQLANNIIFMHYDWATNINPPSPVSSIYNLDMFLAFINQYIPPDKVIIGISTIGYDWELPYMAGLSNINPITLENAINLARNYNAIIQFDEISQTPFFRYALNNNEDTIHHIVWFIDARSINSLLDLITKYVLQGTGIWNITIFNPQLWLIINSQYTIKKFLPGYFSIE